MALVHEQLYLLHFWATAFSLKKVPPGDILEIFYASSFLESRIAFLNISTSMLTTW